MFNNPYQQQMLSYPQPTPITTPQLNTPRSITRVNGENGARMYQMPPNSEDLLLDESLPIVWLVQTDGAGYKTVTPYDVTPHQTQATPDFNSLESRIKKLEDIINESHSKRNRNNESRKDQTGVSNG